MIKKQSFDFISDLESVDNVHFNIMGVEHKFQSDGSTQNNTSVVVTDWEEDR
jgi:hypothetical protein